MTTRFSLSELAEMLQVPVDAVRRAVDELAAAGQLTAESFVFADRNWRIAPSDTKRIQEWIVNAATAGVIQLEPPRRKWVRKRVERPAEDGAQMAEGAARRAD
ncbi:MAG: hypothetical protein K6T78_01315 [Alicyclobacillus sp.]|nr:hypothetical protein [Alicyclobacillus sp.]